MKIVVVGGTGLIGSKLVNKLKGFGHEVVAASPSKGINAITGEGLAEALKNTQVVVDVANAPSFEDKAVLEFFETSGKNLMAAEKNAGVGYHIALSVVGSERLTESGYFRAKIAQEKLIQSSPIPYTIVRATQFFEFLGSIAEGSADGQSIHLPPALMQPMAAEDVAALLLQVVSEKPVNGIIEIAGPERFPISDIVEQYLRATKDQRTVISDVNAKYYGLKVMGNMLVPNENARMGSTTFKNWINTQKK